MSERKPAGTPDYVNEDERDTIATPEGDGEFNADEPISPNPPPVQRPRGDRPHSKEPLRPAE